jgi:hypothetical protein
VSTLCKKCGILDISQPCTPPRPVTLIVFLVFFIPKLMGQLFQSGNAVPVGIAAIRRYSTRFFIASVMCREIRNMEQQSRADRSANSIYHAVSRSRKACLLSLNATVKPRGVPLTPISIICKVMQHLKGRQPTPPRPPFPRSKINTHVAEKAATNRRPVWSSQESSDS